LIPVPALVLALALPLALILVGCSTESEDEDQALPAPTILTAAEIADQWEANHHLDTRPVRETVGLELQRFGWKYDCMECHQLLKARWHHAGPLVEHRGLKLEHGANRFCLNCHHPTNRNAFVDYDGSEIAEQDVVLLCAKCHGPTYRDWKHGIHGRQTGSWKVPIAERSRLRCIQCHDPHRPAFPALAPEAAPHYPERAAHPPQKSLAQHVAEE
jgi:hypothetical protein